MKLNRDSLQADDLPGLVDQIGEAVSALLGDVKGSIIMEKMQETLA
jgi:hypothetical protein